jgi:hypothetical protein
MTADVNHMHIKRIHLMSFFYIVIEDAKKRHRPPQWCNSILLQVSDDTTSTETRQEGKNAQDPSEKIMALWTFDVKFPHDTEFIFKSLTFATEEDGDLKMLP